MRIIKCRKCSNSYQGKPNGCRCQFCNEWVFYWTWRETLAGAAPFIWMFLLLGVWVLFIEWPQIFFGGEIKELWQANLYFDIKHLDPYSFLFLLVLLTTPILYWSMRKLFGPERME